MSTVIAQRVCTRTHKIAIERLKGIRGLDEVSLEDKPITGIFGPNGAGKSTVLHALAAAYKAPDHASDHHYKKFFPRLDQDVWNGTQFVITHSGSSDNTTFSEAENEYRKGAATTKWNPLETRRPEREVLYIGLKNCLPALERYSTHDLHSVVHTELTDRPDTRAIAAMGRILNGNYAKAFSLTTQGSTKEYSAFERSDLGCTYPSVTMGSGEQRLFAMLQLIERTRNNALILIDEFDLLLHGDALEKLITHLHAHCEDKNKQIVFTSHREELLRFDDKINVRHLYRLPDQDKHTCFPNTDPDSLHRLTGQRQRPLEIFVEDRMAEAIVEQVARKIGILRHVEVVRFGCATNCFTVLAGLLLKGESCDHSLFVLDGDVHLDPEDREKQIAKACGGDDENAEDIRTRMGDKITDFTLPADTKPEPHLHRLVSSLDDASVTDEEREIKNLAVGITNPPDRHQFIDKIVEQLGGERSTQLQAVVRMAAKHPDWDAYVQPVREWLEAKKTELSLT